MTPKRRRGCSGKKAAATDTVPRVKVEKPAPVEEEAEEEEPFIPSDLDEASEQDSEAMSKGKPTSTSPRTEPKSDDEQEASGSPRSASITPAEQEAQEEGAAAATEVEEDTATSSPTSRGKRRQREESSSSSSSASDGEGNDENKKEKEEEEEVRASNGRGSLTDPRSGNGEESRASGHTRPRSTTRLVIRDIDVENFKSYYGQHRIGPFHKTFTAVIGPNGSGKSNVIDSMLFVFGRNAKKIRLEKLSELIHNSAAHPNVNYASVTVNFARVREETLADVVEPTQREEIVGSEICIKREVFRSGVSQYYIDSRRTSQKEVVQRLIDEGVDLEHNRFLILQGEVEQIALMKPKAEKEGEEGLLEYLDDLIGTNEFVTRINEATKHAEDAQAERLDALDQERKMKAEREALDTAKNSTLAFVTKDSQLQKTLIVMCQLRMRGIEERLVEPRRLLEEIDKRIGGYEEDVAVRRETKVQAEEAVAQRKKELAEATKERDTVRQKKQAEEAQLEKLKSGADEQEKATSKFNDQIKKCKDEIQKASLQQQDAEREATIHQQNHDEAAEQVELLQQQHDKLSEELLPKLRPLRQELEKKKRDFAPFAKAVTQATEQLNTAKGRLDTLEEAEDRKQTQLTQLQQQSEQRTVRVAEVESALAEAEGGDRQREELRHLQDLLTEATQRKYTINNNINEMKNLYREGEQDDRAMEFLLSQRNLKGYYGTLRQLGRIDDTYDIAAGMASNAWGFHVVEDRATATAALEVLKKNNMGRATMMVVSEIDREMGGRVSKPFTPPNPKAQRLFDLIMPTNAKFRTVFYQAVRDTLVVPTLTEARETAFGTGGRGQRFRVVSMRGELVEPSGTITGGGAAPRGARLKAARSPQDKQAIREDLQRLQTELGQAVEEERAAQLRLHAMHEKEKRVSPEQLRKLRTELRSLGATRENDAQRLEALEKELAALHEETVAKRAALQEEVDACERSLKAAMQARQSQHEAVEQLEKRVEDEGGSAFRDVTEQLKKQSSRVEAEDTALRSCRRLAQKLRATQERKEKDLTDYKAALDKLKAEAEEGLREKVAEHVKQLEEITAQLNLAEAALAAAQAANDEARAAVPIVNSALVEAQKCLDDETRYRQTESAKMADALQELAKFEQKIEGCEEKIKENAELYGVETLQLEGDAVAGNGNGNEEEDDEEEEGEEEGNGDDDDDEEDEEQQGNRHRRRGGKSSKSGHKRRRRERGSNSSDDEEEDDHHRSRRASAGGAAGRSSSSANTNNTNAAGATQQAKAAAQIRAMTFKLSHEELDRCDYERSVHLAKALSEETKRLHSDIDFRAVALWRERDLAHRQALAVYEERKRISDEADLALLDMKEERRDAFMAVFNSIRKKLKEVYQLLTHGGDADMELVDVNDPFEGIHFVVRPPKKSWKQISNLSGGEKTLSSLALIFSLHHIKPTPIYVMDEIDAALDFRNVSIVANYVLRQASGAQFIIISLRNNMFEQAHQLVGVCKVKDVTATLVLMPRAFQQTMQRRLERAKEKHLHRQREQAGTQQPSPFLPHQRPQPQLEGRPSTVLHDRTNRMDTNDKETRSSPEELAEQEVATTRKARLSVEEEHAQGNGNGYAESGRPSSLASGPASRRSVRFGDDVK